MKLSEYLISAYDAHREALAQTERERAAAESIAALRVFRGAALREGVSLDDVNYAVAGPRVQCKIGDDIITFKHIGGDNMVIEFNCHRCNERLVTYASTCLAELYTWYRDGLSSSFHSCIGALPGTAERLIDALCDFIEERYSAESS